MSYARPISPPANMKEGLANAVQIIINEIEAGNSREALLQAVNLLDDVRSKSNPYGIAKKRKPKPAGPEYRGDVNVD